MAKFWLTSNGKSVIKADQAFEFPTMSYYLEYGREILVVSIMPDNGRLDFHHNMIPRKNPPNIAEYRVTFYEDYNDDRKFCNDMYINIDYNRELVEFIDELMVYMRMIYKNEQVDDQLLLDLFNDCVKWLNYIYDAVKSSHIPLKENISNISFKKGKSAKC